MVIYKPNSGLASARNAGLNEASRRYVYFCESDGYSEKNERRFNCAGGKNYDERIRSMIYIYYCI